MADLTIGSTPLPADLNTKSQPDLDKDFFQVTASGLKIGTSYDFQFQYVFADGALSEWSPTYRLTTAGYQTKLTKPSITLIGENLSYSVSYTQQTDKNFLHAIVEEVVTESNTVPTSGWTIVAISSSNPVLVPTGNKLKRWVRVRLADKISGFSPYSDPAQVTPRNIIDEEVDETPPNEVTITSAQWVGTAPNEQIQINYTIPATDGGVDFILELTGGGKTRPFYINKVGTSLNQVYSITIASLEAAFGLDYATSFTGLFRSRDKAGNISSGTPFSIGSASNGLNGVTPVAVGTAIANGFSISWNLGSATYAKVYTSTTSGFTPNEGQPAQYTGAGPYIENTSTTSGFSTVYYRVKFFGPKNGDYSNFSAEGSVTPLNPDVTDTTPPPAITSATGTGSTNTQDPSGISGQISLSIVQPSMPIDLGGYTIKIVNGGNTWYQDFPTSTALSTIVVRNGILVGQSYTVSIATRDKINNYASYVAASNNPISISDTRTNTSVATNLIISATDSIATASWTAPVDTNVGSYRIQLTTNADTTFSSPIQEIFTDSTQTSFGGLTASTTYRVRVTSKYSNNGPLSTNHVSTTFTLNASGAISDGIAPTTNPALTSAMVKSLFGAFAITFPEVTNSDAVTYEVFIKPTDSTGIVSNTYKVLEVSGTFAVVKTLAGGTTALSYGTDYYIAIRAKDNDGVSTGAVTAVGPVQTLQVQNADLAADSVYANNIKAGEIDASKMITDLLFTNKTINVGETTSTNRIRLDANTATISGQSVKSRIFIGTGNYDDAGTSFYADNIGRVSIKDKLKFDGTNLQIDANGSFGGLLTAGPTGQKVKIGLDAGGSGLHGINLEATGDYIYNSGNFRLGAGKITYNGNLDISSQVTITGSSTITGDLGITGVNGTFYAGASKSTGNRVVMNSGGLFGYSGGSTNFSFPNSTGQFTLGTGEISGWSVNSGTIEKQTGSTYAGISTGTYAFFAGGGSAGSGTGSGAPKFTVTQAGVLSATGVNIKDGKLDIGADWPSGFHVDSSGNLKAANAIVKGEIQATTGTIGNINIDSGGLYIGASPSSGDRIVLNSAGIQAISGAATVFQLAKDGTGKIGGWTYSASTLSSGSITLNALTPSITVSSAINAIGLYGATDDLDESNDSDANGNVSTIGAGSSNPTLTIGSSQITSTGVLQLNGQSYTEIISGGTQSAMFSSDRSSMRFTTGLYLGDPNKSSQSNVQSTNLTTRVPWISIDASLRLRKGAPLKYPNGSAGAYVRNIYIKQTSNTTIAPTTGNIGDIFITY